MLYPTKDKKLVSPAKQKDIANNSERILSKDDAEMMNELDYEDKKKSMPYDPYRRDWDEA